VTEKDFSELFSREESKMVKRRFLLIFLLLGCVIALTSCPTPYEKRMAGNFYLSKMSLLGQPVEPEDAFDDATVVLTTDRKFSIRIEFKPSYIDNPATYESIKNSMPDNLTDAQINEVIALLREGVKLTGTFSNNNGNPIFTPDGTSDKPSKYGFNRFNYNFEKDILSIGGTYVNAEFTKIK
jgi:hypothetical protein